MNDIFEDAQELPNGWAKTKLEDICTITMGQSPPSSTYNTNNLGLPFYQGKSEFNEIYPTPRIWCSSPKKIAEKGDILLSVRAPVGPTNICPEKSCIGRGLTSIRYLGYKDSNFIFYLFRQIENRLSQLGTGSTFQAISKSDVVNLSIPLPPLLEQHRIVAKLEELFTKLDVSVAELKKAKAQIKRYRQSVLKHAFEGKLTEEWRKQTSNVKGETAEELLAKIKEERKKALGKKYKELPPVDTTNLPQLPDGWVWTSLEQITSVLGDGLHGTPKYSVDGEYYFINGNNLSDGKIEIKSDTKRVSLEEFNKYKKPLSDRTIFVSINGTLGNTAFYDKENIILGKSACYFNVDNQIDKHYVRYLLVSQRFTDYANNTATGSTIKNVPLSAMRAFEIPIASTNQEQEIIVSEIERHFSVADETEKIIDQSLMQAERLSQSILKDAFSGKLVPQDPSDEPAEKLLEMIKAEREKISKTKSNHQALPDGSPKENKKRRIK